MCGFGGNTDPHNPVEVKHYVGIFQTNTNPKFKLFRVGGWVAGLSGNIDHLNPIEVEVEVGLGLSLAKSSNGPPFGPFSREKL